MDEWLIINLSVCWLSDYALTLLKPRWRVSRAHESYWNWTALNPVQSQNKSQFELNHYDSHLIKTPEKEIESFAEIVL